MKTIDVSRVVPPLNPLREKIIFLFEKHDELSAAMAAKELEEGLSQLSYHFRILRELGAIKEVRTVPKRGAIEHLYKLQPGVLVEEASK